METTQRRKFTSHGRLIFEWDQTIDEVNMFIAPPPCTSAHMFDINITHNHIKVGLKPKHTSSSSSPSQCASMPSVSSSMVTPTAVSGVHTTTDKHINNGYDHNTESLSTTKRGDGENKEQDKRTYFLDEDTCGIVNREESFWMLEDGVLHIQLGKAKKGEVWSRCLVCEDQLDPWSEEQTKQKIMLERFQEENPGFDFSGASFSGQAPDPRTFMGGVSYK
eukprot:GHVQ01013010.1.p1 GENE.GHVQ01013010.1~~GHVQ01013010.1.p1  ORF type:complete len:220 (+),score=42.03 GHVQ01013010.1:213-872(+)